MDKQKGASEVAAQKAKRPTVIAETTLGHLADDGELVASDGTRFDQGDIARMERPPSSSFKEDSAEFYRWYEYGGVPRERPLDAQELATFLIEDRGYSREEASDRVSFESHARADGREVWNAVAEHKSARRKKMQASKLSALSWEQLKTLTRLRDAEGRNWKSKLLQMFATGKDERDPVLRQIRNSHLDLMKQLTNADFEAPITVRYGTVAMPEQERTLLESLGVEIADYDHQGKHFVVRVSDDAYNQLKEIAFEATGDLHPFDDRQADTWRFDMRGLTEERLRGIEGHFHFRIYSDENDGRVTAAGSARLDLWMGVRQEAQDELRRRAHIASVGPSPDPAGENDKRAVIYSDSYGVFIGEALGLAFWSKLETGDQPGAATFIDEADAQDYMKGWLTPPPDDVRVVSVIADMPRHGASVAACVRAGLPDWAVPSRPDDISEAHIATPELGGAV